MQLTKDYICILLAIALREDKGILEETLIQYAIEYIPEAIDVSEIVDQFEKAGWISMDWEVLVGDKNAIKTRHCKITETGKQMAAGLPVTDRRSKFEDAASQPSAQSLGEYDELLSLD